jgi:hypothetical protein
MTIVSKERFKEVYFKLGLERDGWGLAYWDEHFEKGARPDMRYALEEPASPKHDRMMIVSDFEAKEHRLFFMTEDSEEDFFRHPGD